MHTKYMTNTTRKTAAATIGNGTAVHAVDYDVDHPKYGLCIELPRGLFSASTVCGQVAGRKGYRRPLNDSIEAAVTCKKCAAAIAKR